MENTTPGRKKRLSPRWIGVTAFLITIALGISAVAAILLVGPLTPAFGDVIKVVSNGTCPAAIVVAVLAYFLAKGRQKNH